MNVARILYRSRQFWEALFSAPLDEELESVRSLLNPAQMALFCSMQRSEQAHSIRVMRALLSKGEALPEAYRHDVLVAGLLHDAGKSLHPLRIWERVWIVLFRRLFPERVRQLGEGTPSGWRRAFVVAERHPEWGAQMAAQAGSSALAVSLIRRHQDHIERGNDLEDQLLSILQSVDREY